MSILLEKAQHDYAVVQAMQKINDEEYLDVCCYHIQQAIEKLLKYAIEMRGVNYPHTHNIALLYTEYCKLGYEEVDNLELFAGTLTEWESSSRYKESFYATIKQLNIASNIFSQLLNILQDIEEEVTESHVFS